MDSRDRIGNIVVSQVRNSRAVLVHKIAMRKVIRNVGRYIDTYPSHTRAHELYTPLVVLIGRRCSWTIISEKCHMWARLGRPFFWKLWLCDSTAGFVSGGQGLDREFVLPIMDAIREPRSKVKNTR